ncbi:restriction endonuclease subunit S [Enterococcus durans]|uniref:restriction endonuclease subunit S n=1 Tax=Enterococcus durans TaxID=53345 RepID=UPI0018820C37|nr:restriction endonuclease subunit S [Enterococcus durans]MBE8849154.1 restriction endonuclease subunit S [Enterococcus durans]
MSNDTQPEIRFPGFTEDWEQRKLGDLGSVAMNKRIFKDQTSDNGEVPFFKIGTFGSYPDAFISRELFEEYKSKYPYPEVGDILISASGSIGRTVVYQGEDEYFQDSNIVWLKHNGRLDNKFLQQFYSIVKWQGLEGSTIKRLYNKNILDTNISVPTLDEQNKLGAFFEQLDDTIALHQRKLDLLKETKKGFLQKMFPKNGAKVPEIRFPGFTGDWEQRKLGELANIVRGASPRPIQDPKWFDTESDVGWLRISDVTEQDGRIHYLKQRISKLGQEKTRVLTEPHLLLSIAATVGKPVVNYVKTGVHDGFLIFLNPIFEREFIFQWLEMFRPKWQKYGQPGSQVNLNSELVRNQEISLPSGKEQKKIGNFFKQLDDTITLHQRKLDLLKETKKGFLQKMFV